VFYTGIGSRTTPASVLRDMEHIAQGFASKGWVLRSGGAAGADSAFERGAGDRVQIFLPWRGFRDSASKFTAPSDAAMQLAGRFHPAWEHCSPTARKFHARNAHQILGPDLDSPSSLVVCWTPGGELVGGTAQALRMATHYGIPVFNLGSSQGLPALRDWWRANM
jgi:hypothetical protein